MTRLPAFVDRVSAPVIMRRGTDRLLALQYVADGPTYLQGEFPMRVSDRAPRVDHNYLSGYALLHIALAADLPGLPGPVATALQRLLDRAQDLPGRYQSEAGLGNWYSGRGTGLPCPAGYPWPGGQILCLQDDYDDTAVSSILTTLAPLRLSRPITAATFTPAAHDPGSDQLVPNSVRRLQMAGAGAGVYQSWALMAHESPSIEPLPVWLPTDNSVELTTVANVFTAVHRLGGGAAHQAQEASRAFVNALTAIAVNKLLAHDASSLDFASTYYPRFPFAPLAFVVHDHVLTGGTLLDQEVARLVARAVADADPCISWRMAGFGTAAFWLNCCAWCLQGGLLSVDDVNRKLERVWRGLHGGRDGGLWPDLVFFFGAHLGNYSGRAYALALMVETAALLHGMGLA